MAMTLEEVRDGLRDYFIAANTDGVPFPHVSAEDLGNWCEALTTHLTQPAQAVDVGAIRDVIDDLREWGETDKQLAVRAETLTRALAGEQAGWRVPEMIVDLAECRKAGWNDGARAYRAGWNACRAEMLAARPASPTPDKETQR